MKGKKSEAKRCADEKDNAIERSKLAKEKHIRRIKVLGKKA